MKEAKGSITSVNDWNKYTAVDHLTWDTLFNRQKHLLEHRAHEKFLEGLKLLNISNHRIPKFDEINKQLIQLTGWIIAPVTELIPGRLFFELLSKRQFPVGTFIRRPDQLDYLEEPDVFHDLFGHVPILSDLVFADFMQLFGEIGIQAVDSGFEDQMTRLYWFTVEFGLINTSQGLRIYGGGILSSKTESVYALESDEPDRLTFDIIRIMRSKFRLDQFQKTYFVVNSFNQLFESLQQDWRSLCEEAKHLGDIEDGVIIESDHFFNKNKKCDLSLKDHKCIACHGGMPSLLKSEAQILLKQLHQDWTINKSGHLERIFVFKDFQQPMLFAQKIAQIAEKEGHHPDLHISCGKCIVEIWTHKINGFQKAISF